MAAEVIEELASLAHAGESHAEAVRLHGAAQALHGALLSGSRRLRLPGPGRERKRPSSGWASLTPTELEVVALAAAAFGMADAGADGHTEFVFIEQIVESRTVDHGEAGVDQGDRMVYRSDVLDDDGKSIGSGGGECISVAPAGDGFGVTHCVGYVRLAGGQLAFNGPYDTSKSSGVVAITGGTGDYTGAGGTLAFEALDDDTYRDKISLTD